ncbi:MAG TPA: ATP-binding protein, partial [Oligoflexia bacterium]|nr:ATP-binding protein [Oligoflexia bacterium]
IYEYELDASGRLVLVGVNPAADVLTGAENSKLVGKCIDEAFPNLADTDIVEHFTIAAKYGRSWSRQEVIYDDRTITGTFDVHAFQTAPGRIAVLFSNVMDRVQSERALRESEAAMRSIFRAAPIGIGVIVDRVIVRANDYLCAMLGYASEEMLGRNSSFIYPNQEEYERVGRLKYNLMREKGTGTVETRWVRKDGSIIDVCLSSSPIDPADWSAGVTFTALDITDRKNNDNTRQRLEMQLRQSQKMEAVGQLAGGIAHDFNNLLLVIQGFTELALTHAEENSPAAHYLKQVEKAALQASSLTRQLLTFSRRDTFKPGLISVRSLIDDLLGLLRRTLGEQIELRTHLQAEEEICADETLIKQLIMNLCINSRDAMPEGGSLIIETSAAQFDAEYCRTNSWAKPGSYLCLRVSDTGCGIAAEAQEHVFEPFFTTKEVGKGTGLGLATVYAIVERHDGMIRLHSEPGQGTTFYVYFPKDKAVADLPQAREADAAFAGGSETILLAEDEELVRDLGERILTDAGYKLITAKDGEEAILLVETHAQEISLAIIDVVMPKKSGRQVAEAIRKCSPCMPILFATGYSMGAVNAEDLIATGAKMIEKPYSRQDLLLLVRQMLDALAPVDT